MRYCAWSSTGNTISTNGNNKQAFRVCFQFRRTFIMKVFRKTTGSWRRWYDIKRSWNIFKLNTLSLFQVAAIWYSYISKHSPHAYWLVLYRCIDFLHLVLISQNCYYYLVTNWGKETPLGFSIWEGNMHAAISGLAGLTCQLFYLHRYVPMRRVALILRRPFRRIWVFSSKNKPLVLLLTSLCLTTFALDVTISTNLMLNRAVSEFSSLTTEAIVLFAMGAGSKLPFYTTCTIINWHHLVNSGCSDGAHALYLRQTSEKWVQEVRNFLHVSRIILFDILPVGRTTSLAKSSGTAWRRVWPLGWLHPITSLHQDLILIPDFSLLAIGCLVSVCHYCSPGAFIHFNIMS